MDGQENYINVSIPKELLQVIKFMVHLYETGYKHVAFPIGKYQIISFEKGQNNDKDATRATS